MSKNLVILMVCLFASTSVLAAESPPAPTYMIKSDGIIYDVLSNLFGFGAPQG